MLVCNVTTILQSLVLQTGHIIQQLHLQIFYAVDELVLP